MPSFKRITDLPSASAIAGSELVEVSQLSATIRISASTISAAAADNSLNHSGSGFVAAGFQPGDRVQVSGFATSGNNMVAGVIVSVTAGKIVIGGGPILVNEAAGAAVTISKWTSRRIDLNTAVANTAAVQANTAKAGNANHTGDVTGSTALTIATGAVSNAKMANMGPNTLKGRLTSSGAPQDLSGTQVTSILDTFTATLKGLVPPPGGTPSGTTRFLREDGTWANPSAIVESIIIAAGDETSALTTGAAKVTFRMPYAFTLTAVRASLTTAQTTGSILTVDINENGTSILSTKLTIDNGEKTSTTAAAAPVISDSSLGDDAEITIDIDQVGTGGAGLKVVLIGSRA